MSRTESWEVEEYVSEDWSHNFVEKKQHSKRDTQHQNSSFMYIATAYGLDVSGIESRWGEIFRTSPDRPKGPPSLLYNGYRVFPGGKLLPGRDADPSPPSSAEV